MSINVTDILPPLRLPKPLKHLTITSPCPCNTQDWTHQLLEVRSRRQKGANISASCTHQSYINSCSILIFIPSINDLSCDASFVVMEQAMTGRDTPHALPRAILLDMISVWRSWRQRLRFRPFPPTAEHESKWKLTSVQKHRARSYPRRAKANEARSQSVRHRQTW